MSLWSLYLNRQTVPPGRQQINEALSGNLCRCTGYRPIIDAAVRMGELPEVIFDRNQLAGQLQSLQRAEMFVYGYDGHTFYAPRTLDELVAVRSEHPLACMVSGATDAGLWVTKQLRELGDIIYLRQVAELAGITERDGKIEIGAAVSLCDAYRAVIRHYPELSEMAQRFASLPVRHAGTLVGNIANGSPIGDSAPWMISLDADIVLRSQDGQRILALESFYLDYMKKDLRPGEFVEAVRIPLPVPGLLFRTYKLAKRFDQDISGVCAAFSVTLTNRIVQNAHIVYGGMAATSKRAPETEAALNGEPWNETTVERAIEMLVRDYTPLTDMRASGTYRMKAAQNLLRRYWLETGSDGAAATVSVFAERRSLSAEP